MRVNSIAQKIANRICLAFPEHGFSQIDLFSSLSRLDMYLAKFEDTLCGAKYFYGNSTIYFNIDYFTIQQITIYLFLTKKCIICTYHSIII